MFKRNPRIPAPGSVGPASAGPLTPSDPSPSSIVSIRAAPLRGPSSIPRSVGAIPFGAADGELMTSTVDAHSRSEAAYPIVATFMAHFARPKKLNGETVQGKRVLAIAKGQPLAFASMPRDTTRTAPGIVNTASTFGGEVKTMGTTRHGRGRKDQERFACFVGDNNDDHIAANFENVFVAVASEPMVVRFAGPNREASELTAVACCLEHQAPVYAESLAPSFTKQVDHPAGTSVLIGVHGTSVKAYAGAPSELQKMCAAGFRPLRHAISLVPFRCAASRVAVQTAISAGGIPTAV